MARRDNCRLRRPLFVTVLFLASFYFVESLSSVAEQTHCLPVWFDSSNHLHRDLQYHPEQPERITRCVEAIAAESNGLHNSVQLVDVSNEHSQAADSLSTKSKIRGQPLGPQKIAEARQCLLRTHTEELVVNLEKRTRDSKEKRLSDGKGSSLGHMGYLDGGDTYVTTESLDVCLRATACWMQAVEHILAYDRDKARDNRFAFVLSRPPGHHATRSVSNGFCLFNFAAAAATHAVQVLSQEQKQQPGNQAKAPRISILDWDVHYGQGVADIVAHQLQDTVRYVSLHQTPAFPYQGEQKGCRVAPNVLTLPLPPDSSWTCGYRDALEQALEFVADPNDWEPDLVVVCAGYDALTSDDLAGTNLVASDYGTITRLLLDRLPPGTPVMFGLEGGYQLREGSAGGNLPDAVVETLHALVESSSKP